MSKTPLFKNYIHDWLQSKEGYVKESTYSNYSHVAFNHILPSLGDNDVNVIDEDLLNHTAAHWLMHIPLSKNSVTHMMMITKLSLNYARKKISLPRIKAKIKLPITEEQNRFKIMIPQSKIKLIKAITKNLDSRNIGILFALNTGIRIGELCALKWCNINMDNNIITIEKTLQRIHLQDGYGTVTNKIVITSPKTKSSIRDIPISSHLQKSLAKMGAYAPDTYLLTGTSKYIEPRAYRSYFYKYLKTNQIDKINFHGLRHTFATDLIEQGADVKTVSELLGHANVNTTLNLYVHPSLAQKRKCIEMLSM
ncbi:MAG: site-specific integrase [Clostridiales Family XIII bacterium]|nr:site-specific integrase [Clostridiales Family XIII bacterium]